MAGTLTGGATVNGTGNDTVTTEKAGSER